jgi:hypothetical protein
MDIKQFIVQSLEGKPVQAKETLNDLLSNRAFEALDSKKQQIAKTLYGDGEDTEVQDTEDEDYEEEFLTQEEFFARYPENQELYLEAMEQIDELSKDTYKDYLLKTRSLQKKHHAGSQLSRYGEIGKKDRDLNTELGRAHAKKQLKKEDVEEIDEDTMTHIQLKRVPGTSGKVTHVHYKGKKIGSITKNVPKSGNMVRDAATGKVRKATLPQAPGANKATYTASHSTSKNDSDWDKKEHAVQQIRDLESDVRRDNRDR